MTLQWTGLGCDVCGFGTIEDVDAFDPRLPCPDCGEIMMKSIGTCDTCGTVAYAGWRGDHCPSVPYGSCDGTLIRSES